MKDRAELEVLGKAGGEHTKEDRTRYKDWRAALVPPPYLKGFYFHAYNNIQVKMFACVCVVRYFIHVIGIFLSIKL